MKDKRLTIQIKKPVYEIVAFVLNPKNTPLWIESLAKEETNEWPVKVGTIYRNLSKEGKWNEYTLMELRGDGFTMTQKGNNYHVKYTLTPVNKNTTMFEYYEWVDQGELEEPFAIEVLQKLKEVIENE